MAKYDEKEDRSELEEDSHQDVLVKLQKAQSADHDMRENARESFLFVTAKDGQWEPYWWSANEKQPRYQFDMVNPIIDQVAGELEQADFDIRVNPAGGNATKDIAETYDGLIRNIENMSQAKTVYNQAARGMITTGYDGWRVSPSMTTRSTRTWLSRRSLTSLTGYGSTHQLSSRTRVTPGTASCCILLR